MGNIIGGLAGGLVTGLFGKSSAKKAANAQVQSAQIAAEQFRPFNVSSDLATSTVSGDTITLGLKGGATDLLDQYLQRALQTPEQSVSGALGILDRIAAPKEEETRRTTRELLFQSGRLGTHSGTREISAVEEAIQRNRLQRELAAYDIGQAERQGAFGNFLALAQAPASNIGPLTVNRNPAATVAAQGILNAGATRAGGDLAFNTALGKGIGSLTESLFKATFGSGGGLSSLFSSSPPAYTPPATGYSPSSGFYGPF